MALLACLAVLASVAQAGAASSAAPKWKLVLSDSAVFSVRGNTVSGHIEVRLVGVRLPPFSKNKRDDSQPGGRGWVLAQHDPQNVRLVYKGQTVRATQSLRTDEVEPAIQYHFYLTPRGAAKPVFSNLGRGRGTLLFTTKAGSVRMSVPVLIRPYG
jgi:hypothetical protein